ncbi:SH3 domain-containing protein [Thiohalorhabdus methylotrophus]|uniref:SH3 domain-containing protein n=1 Tax=Thiohalorhabdus methylotrophus TaxID=3242694 RepID=A0ABV4TVR5_9GAMM
MGGRRTPLAVGLVVALLAAVGTAQAATYKSIDAGKVNLRAGPGTDQPRRWVVSYGYPLQVVETRDGWAKVKDYEGDVAWVSEKLLSDRRTVLVTRKLVNVRAGPGTDHDIAFQAERHVLLTYLGQQGSWVHVRHADGDEGWVYAPLVWGD